MRSGAGQQRGVHGTTWFMFVSHKIQRFRPQMCEITSRRGCWGPSRTPTLARTQSNPGVRWQLKPAAAREWVVYTITDRIKHVCLSAVRQVRVLQKHTSRNKNPSQYLENAHGVRACEERAHVYTHIHTYKDLRSLLSPFFWNVARRAPSELVPWNTPCSPLASFAPPEKK